MTKFSKFTSIEQYRNVIRNIKYSAQNTYDPETGEVTNNPHADLPVVKFTGTVKLHGTNAGVSSDGENVWAQSRTRIITPENDNHSFAFWVETNKEYFRGLISCIREVNQIPAGRVITVFGEWCGQGVQGGVALAQIPKMFVIFRTKVLSDNEGESNSYLPGTGVNSLEVSGNETPGTVRLITEFPTYEMDIDFANPEESQNRLIEITQAVEAECPVGKAFGVSGVGEGVVWKGSYNDTEYLFKVKGEKHSASKVKKLAAVDVEKVNNIKEFVEYAVSENRLAQGLDEHMQAGYTLEMKDVKHFIAWIQRDVVKEELDTMASAGLTPKDVSGAVTKAAVAWFKAQ